MPHAGGKLQGDLQGCRYGFRLPGSHIPGANFLYANCEKPDGTNQQNFLDAEVTDAGCVYAYPTQSSAYPTSYVAAGDLINVNGVLTCAPPAQPPTQSCNALGGACTENSGGKSAGQNGGGTPSRTGQGHLCEGAGTSC